jgi:hypothetical protein
MKDEELVTETTFCPCSGKCCNNPDVICPKHKCIEDVCEDCFVSECKNCGGWCCCDL